MPEPIPDPPPAALAETPLTARTVGLYLVCFWAVLLIPDFALRYKLNELFAGWADGRAVAQVSLHAKLAHHLEHAAEYDLLFVGDSRTFTNISPDLLDPQLGTRSFNLGRMANWFPTQYPSYRELAARVPEGTVVVWSIGHQNFRATHPTVNDAYPIGVTNAPTYLHWGYSPSAIGANVAGSVPGLRPFQARLKLYGQLDALFALPGPQIDLGSPAARDVESPLAPPTPQHPAQPADPLQPAQPAEVAPVSSGAPTRSLVDELARLEADPRVYSVRQLTTEQGRVASLEVLMHAGNYLRVELEPDYFRAKQREHATGLRPHATERFEASPEYWATFLAILDTFEAHGVKLIVNEFEEAPYQYADPHNRRIYREFMAEVRRHVESRGIPFVRIDFERLNDAQYFDYNHLNSDGVAAFSELFVPELRAALQRVR